MATNESTTPAIFRGPMSSPKYKSPTRVTNTSLVISHSRFITVNDSNDSDFKKIHGCSAYTNVGNTIHRIPRNQPKSFNQPRFKARIRLNMTASIVAMSRPNNKAGLIF